MDSKVFNQEGQKVTIKMALVISSGFSYYWQPSDSTQVFGPFKTEFEAYKDAKRHGYPPAIE